MKGRDKARVARWAFRGGPTVVRSRYAVVDFFPRAGTDVVDEDATGVGVNAESERIAQAESPDGAVLAGGRREERVVRRDGAVAVVAQHFAEAVVERL